MIGTVCMWQARENADYIVDGLCRQLRHLDEHPRHVPCVYSALVLLLPVHCD